MLRGIFKEDSMGSGKIDYVENIDFEKIEKILRDKKMTHKDLAVLMGRGRNMLSAWKRSGRIPRVSMPLLCNILCCKEEDLQMSEHDGQTTAQVDAHVIAELGEIKGDLQLIMANFMNMHEDLKAIREAISPDLLTNKDKAVLLLKQMMRDSGRVEEHDYISKCNEIGVDNHSRKYAMEKMECLTQTIGYGHNAKRVIFKRAGQYE